LYPKFIICWFLPSYRAAINRLRRRFKTGSAGIGAVAPALRVTQVPYLFNPGINALSFVFSAVIGVVFGYFPAPCGAHGPHWRSRPTVASPVDDL
jgi:hypothetical protein